MDIAPLDLDLENDASALWAGFAPRLSDEFARAFPGLSDLDAVVGWYDAQFRPAVPDPSWLATVKDAEAEFMPAAVTYALDVLGFAADHDAKAQLVLRLSMCTEPRTLRTLLLASGPNLSAAELLVVMGSRSLFAQSFREQEPDKTHPRCSLFLPKPPIPVLESIDFDGLPLWAFGLIFPWLCLPGLPLERAVFAQQNRESLVRGLNKALPADRREAPLIAKVADALHRQDFERVCKGIILQAAASDIFHVPKRKTDAAVAALQGIGMSLYDCTTAYDAADLRSIPAFGIAALNDACKTMLRAVDQKLIDRATRTGRPARFDAQYLPLLAVRHAIKLPGFPDSAFPMLLSVFMRQPETAIAAGSFGWATEPNTPETEWAAFVRAVAYVAQKSQHLSPRLFLLRELNDYLAHPGNATWPLSQQETDWLAEKTQSDPLHRSMATRVAGLLAIFQQKPYSVQQLPADLFHPAGGAVASAAPPAVVATLGTLLTGDWVLSEVIDQLVQLAPDSVFRYWHLLRGKRFQWTPQTLAAAFDREALGTDTGPLGALQDQLEPIARLLVTEEAFLTAYPNDARLCGLGWEVCHRFLGALVAACSAHGNAKGFVQEDAYIIRGYIDNEKSQSSKLNRPTGDQVLRYLCYRAADGSPADASRRLETVALCALDARHIPGWAARFAAASPRADDPVFAAAIDADADECAGVVRELEARGLYADDRQAGLVELLMGEAQGSNGRKLAFQCWEALRTDRVRWTPRLACLALRTASRTPTPCRLLSVLVGDQAALRAFSQALDGPCASPVASAEIDRLLLLLPWRVAVAIVRVLASDPRLSMVQARLWTVIGYMNMEGPKTVRGQQLLDYMAHGAFRASDRDATQARDRLAFLLQHTTLTGKAIKLAEKAVSWMRLPFVSGSEKTKPLPASWMLKSVAQHGGVGVPTCAPTGSLLLPVSREENLFWQPQLATPGTVRSTFYYFAPGSPVALELGVFRVYRSKLRAFLTLWREVLESKDQDTRDEAVENPGIYGHPRSFEAASRHPRFIRSRRQLRLRAVPCPTRTDPVAGRKRGSPWAGPDPREHVTAAELETDDTDCGNSDVDQEELGDLYRRCRVELSASDTASAPEEIDDTVDNMIGALCRLVGVETVLFQRVSPHHGSEILDARPESRRHLCAMDGERMGGLQPEVYSGSSGYRAKEGSKQPLLWTPDVGVLRQARAGLVSQHPVEVHRFTGAVRLLRPAVATVVKEEEEAIAESPAQVAASYMPLPGLYLPVSRDRHGTMLVDVTSAAKGAMFMGPDCCVHVGCSEGTDPTRVLEAVQRQCPTAVACAITVAGSNRTLAVPVTASGTPPRYIRIPEVGEGRRPLPRTVGEKTLTWDPVHGAYIIDGQGVLGQIGGPTSVLRTATVRTAEGSLVVTELRPEPQRLALAATGNPPLGAKDTDVCVLTYNVMVEAWQDNPRGKRGDWTDVCRYVHEYKDGSKEEVTPCLNNTVNLVLEALQAGVHIVCLQESGEPVRRALEQTVPSGCTVISDTIPTPEFVIMNTMVIDTFVFTVDLTTAVDWPGYSIVQFALLTHEDLHRPVVVINAHRKHPQEGETPDVAAEVGAMMEHIKKEYHTKYGVDDDLTLWVICGDFNLPVRQARLGNGLLVANPASFLTCCRSDASSVASQDFIAFGAYDNILVRGTHGERFLEVDSPAGGNYGSMIRRHSERLIPASSDHLPLAARITSPYTKKAGARLRGEVSDSESDSEESPRKRPHA